MLPYPLFPPKYAIKTSFMRSYMLTLVFRMVLNCIKYVPHLFCIQNEIHRNSITTLQFAHRS